MFACSDNEWIIWDYERLWIWRGDTYYLNVEIRTNTCFLSFLIFKNRFLLSVASSSLLSLLFILTFLNVGLTRSNNNEVSTVLSVVSLGRRASIRGWRVSMLILDHDPWASVYGLCCRVFLTCYHTWRDPIRVLTFYITRVIKLNKITLACIVRRVCERR